MRGGIELGRLGWWWWLELEGGIYGEIEFLGGVRGRERVVDDGLLRGLGFCMGEEKLLGKSEFNDGLLEDVWVFCDGGCRGGMFFFLFLVALGLYFELLLIVMIFLIHL